jgi:hypothetical protein
MPSTATRSVPALPLLSPTHGGLLLGACVRLCAWLLMLQANGLVPIVEPEVLMDGVHSIERSAEVRAVCVLLTLCLRSQPPNSAPL